MDRLADISIARQETEPSRIVRLRIHVGGIVQGVGFRPFIYRLAAEGGLAGYVLNNPGGVEIEAEGRLERVSQFLSGIAAKVPPQARVDTISAHFVDLTGESTFTIRESEKSSERTVLISPDIATCKDCLKELRDDSDRRYRYPFTNCTNCGPRYTIIRDIPYDRKNTTMDPFRMCPDCQAEYGDPLDRRFHAEPNACWVCGPKVVLRDGSGKIVDCDDPIQAASGEILRGKIAAVKGLGGFHLAVNAADSDAVSRLRERKHREEKPLAIMAKDMDTVRTFASLSPDEEGLLLSPARPIVLLKKLPQCEIAESVAPGNRNLGVMLPYTPVHHLLLDIDCTALVMTSGNISEEPIAVDIEDALERLKGIADCYLDHNREILSRCDDSVVRVLDGEALFLRRSRGYVPLPIEIDGCDGSVLACGAHLKNTVALTRGNKVFVSQHIGDLENRAAFDFFKKSVEQLRKIVETEPEIVAYDLHPDYLSTKFALGLTLKTKIGIQHHHAHIASCLGEAGIEGPVIGIALDGTGYGPDGTIWGGEILISTRRDYRRAAHLEQVKMPGGEKAIKEPWRMAVAHLENALGEDLDGVDLSNLLRRSKKEIEIVRSMLRRGVNCPVTSSCGRLFDAVSSICGVRQSVSYEGQAAIELEMSSRQDTEEAYPVDIERSGDGLIIATGRLMREVVKDVLSGIPGEVVGAKFHKWLAESLVQVSMILREEHGLNTVALSGGCFQNEILLGSLRALLKDRGFEVIINRLVPANDGGISFGQIVVASATVADGSREE
jgi:hydrogenase maturation protein HypF